MFSIVFLVLLRSGTSNELDPEIPSTRPVERHAKHQRIVTVLVIATSIPALPSAALVLEKTRKTSMPRRHVGS